MRSFVRLVAASTFALAFSAPVYAVACSTADISPTAIACAGRYTGNVLDNSAPDVATQEAALAALGFTWDGSNFGAFPKLENLNGATTIDFPGLLNGITYVGIHVGGGKGGGTTSFYKFNAGTDLDSFTLNLSRSSDAVLYGTDPGTPGVPEPSNWAMMLGGFAMLGGVMRARRGEKTSLA
ncbi:MAG: PEPxxWA-CTERM sorting domain-containing protein [Sphingomonas sp.]|nr:PEPxxWA-CTERM sorting domain-containing protein [Sphingomonas sp.]